MITRRFALTLAFAAAAFAPLAAHAQADKAAIKALEGCFDSILVYCNTGSFAAQVAMALRMDGLENVRLLYGGYDEWKSRGGLDAYARATRKN